MPHHLDAAPTAYGPDDLAPGIQAAVLEKRKPTTRLQHELDLRPGLLPPSAPG